MFELGARPDLCSVTCPNPAATSLSRRYASSDGAYANLKAKEVSPIWGILSVTADNEVSRQSSPKGGMGAD